MNVRTITTNNTNAMDIMEEDLKVHLAKQMAVSQANLMASVLNDGFGRPLGPVKPIIHRRVEKVTRRTRTLSYDDGYWAKVEVSDTDHVSYKVFNSGWLAKTFNQIGFGKGFGNTVNGWDSIKQRDTIEATLGATYMAIDEAIAEDLRKTEHGKFLKEMIKTDPENLKAIAQLDMLDKGDGPGAESSIGVSAAQPSTVLPGTPLPYVQNLQVSGSGTYSNKTASMLLDPMALNAGGEDLIKMDPDGEVSFGDKMAEAIKSVVEEPTEKGESNDQ